jgi:hypothetical protein
MDLGSNYATSLLTFDGFFSLLPSHSNCDLCDKLVCWSSLLVSFVFLQSFFLSFLLFCPTSRCLSELILPAFLAQLVRLICNPRHCAGSLREVIKRTRVD